MKQFKNMSDYETKLQLEQREAINILLSVIYYYQLYYPNYFEQF